MSVSNDASMTGGNASGGLSQEAAGVVSISSTGMTVGASANFLVAILTWGVAAAPTAISVTWDGVAMSAGPLVTTSPTTATVGIFYLKNPNVGNKTLAASWTGSTDVYMSCGSFIGADIQTSDNTTVTGTTSITVPSSTDGATVAGFVCDAAAPTTNFTKIFSEAPFNPGGGASYTIGGTSNAHTFTGAGGSVQGLAGIHLISSSVVHVGSMLTMFQ